MKRVRELWRSPKVKVVVFLVSINLLGYFVVNGIYRIFAPMCYDDILESAKADPAITAKVGDDISQYSELEMENYLKGDPAEFELRLLGGKSLAIFKGKLQKRDGECHIIEMDTVFREYKR